MDARTYNTVTVTQRDISARVTGLNDRLPSGAAKET
jgi:hypothetical protein